MFTDDALALLQRTAIQACEPKYLSTPTPAVMLYNHDRADIVSLEHLHAGRSRFRGLYTTNMLAEFVAYTKARADYLGSAASSAPTPGLHPISVFVDAEHDSAEAFFNLGSVHSPGHADDRAQLVLRRTAAYAALLAFVGKPQKQRAVAEWLEDWFDVVSPRYGAADENTGPASLSAAIAAVRDITIASKAEATSVQGDLSAGRSAMEEVEAKSRKNLPSGFVFAARPYDGFNERTFELRLSVLPQDKEPLLALRIVGLADLQEKVAQEFEAKVRDGLPGVQVARGSFKP